MSNPFNNNGGNNPFGNNSGNSNPFNNNQQGNNQGGFNNQGQGQNPFNNQQGNNQQNMFNNQGSGGNQSGNMFGNNNQQGGNQQGGNMSGNNQQGGGMFNNQQGGSMFGGSSMFNNQQRGNNSTSGSMFSGNNQQSNNMFGGNNQQTGSFMGNTGGTMFNQGNNQGNMFGNQNNGNSGNQMFVNNQNYQNTGVQNFQNSLQYQHYLETIRNQLEDCINRIKQKNFDQVRIDPSNALKDQPLNRIKVDQQAVQIIYQFEDIKKKIEQIKTEHSKIEKKSESFSKQMHKKLAIYKKCLLQTTTHHKMINEITMEIQMMNREMNDFFKPLFLAYQSKKTITLKEPNDFDLKISYSILNKLDALGQRVDDIMVCESEETDENVNSTITVFEQLVEYYENIACNFRDFKNAYDIMKRQVVEKQKRGNYEMIIAKVQKKSRENLKSQYKYYDLIRQIDSILAKRDEKMESKRYKEINKPNSMWNYV